MPLTAKYLFIVSMDVEAEYEDLFNEVYDTEHVPNICEKNATRNRGLS